MNNTFTIPLQNNVDFLCYLCYTIIRKREGKPQQQTHEREVIMMTLQEKAIKFTEDYRVDEIKMENAGVNYMTVEVPQALADAVIEAYNNKEGYTSYYWRKLPACAGYHIIAVTWNR